MNASDFNEYIRQGEPSRKEKAQIWQTAIGSQDVDGRKTFKYLLANAKANVEGDITIAEVKKRLDSYFKQARKKMPPTLADDQFEEADNDNLYNENRFGVKFGVKLGVNQKSILEIVAENAQTTVDGMAVKLQISKRAVEINIAKLKACGILIRNGADKNGHWQINKPVGSK